MFWGFGSLIWFLFFFLCCFDYFFIFWGSYFLEFFIFFGVFGFFYDFFLLGFNGFYSPKWAQFLKFSCNSFYLEYTGWRGCSDAVNVTA